jgi:hypothetical protein
LTANAENAENAGSLIFGKAQSIETAAHDVVEALKLMVPPSEPEVK